MTIREIANLAAELTGGTADTDCAIAAATEIAVEYKPLIRRESVPCDGVIRFSALTEPVVSVYAVTLNGKRVPFRTFFDRIELTGQGEAVVEYAYRPEFAADDECPFDGRTAAYGAAAEYCLKNSLFEEASMWDAKFRDSLARQSVWGGYVRRRVWL